MSIFSVFISGLLGQVQNVQDWIIYMLFQLSGEHCQTLFYPSRWFSVCSLWEASTERMYQTLISSSLNFLWSLCWSLIPANLLISQILSSGCNVTVAGHTNLLERDTRYWSFLTHPTGHQYRQPLVEYNCWSNLIETIIHAQDNSYIVCQFQQVLRNDFGVSCIKFTILPRFRVVVVMCWLTLSIFSRPTVVMLEENGQWWTKIWDYFNDW